MPNLPREYHLRRAVQCYEQSGEYRAAAELLAAFGTPTASAEAARRLLILDDLPAAGEAFLAAQQPRAALECFRRAALPARELVCLQALGDDLAVGTLLLDLGRPTEAVAPLQRALAQAEDRVIQARLHFQVAHALGDPAGHADYRAGLALLPLLPHSAESAPVWLALAAWGEAVGRMDRVQEGYAEALRLLDHPSTAVAHQAALRRYRAAAERMGNRGLVEKYHDR